VRHNKLLCGNKKMKKLTIITGYILLILGVASVFPIFNLLSVEFLAGFINLFSEENTKIYFKVVPSKNGHIINYSIIIIGIALIAAGKYAKLKIKQQ
jgi:hypothetical protein